MSYKNCKITFNVRTPVCITYPWIFFDSLIAHLQMRRFDPVDYRKQDSKVVSHSFLRRLKSENSYQVIAHNGTVSHASCSQFDSEMVTTSTIYKRFAASELFRMRNIKMDKGFRIRRGIGHFKDAAIKLVTIPCRTVTFYARADTERLASILQGLPGIGKKTSIGFGFISDYSIDIIRKDCSIIRDGVAMRPIPVRMLESYDDQAVMNWKAPYWGNDVEMCAPPGAKVTMK